MSAPEDLLFRGSLMADGLLFVGDERALRERVLRAWVSGARVFGVAPGLVLVWPRPQRVRAEQAAGLPLVLRAGALVAGPGCRARAVDGQRDNTVVYPFHGEVRREPLDASHERDAASWLAADDVEVLALAPPPIERVPVVLAIPEPEADVRAALGVDLAVSDASLELAAAVQSSSTRDAQGAVRAQPLRARLVAGAASVLSTLAGAFTLGGRGRSGAGVRDGFTGAGAASGATAGGGLAAPSPFLPWLPRVRAWLSNLVWRTRFAALFGAAHARHLRRMLQLFERGELDEALRHAIPLGDPEDPRAHLPTAFGAPGTRDDLTLQLTRTAATSVSPLSGIPGFEATLRAYYMRAFEALRSAGEVEKAAFVLVELLRDVPGAVAYLEREERFELAAKLAEARSLPPATQVRLWAQAGQLGRAIPLARRHGLFAMVIRGLSKQHRPVELVLRRAWAASAAEAGNLLEAADALLPHAETRGEALPHLEACIAAGGALAGGALARALQHDLGDRAQHREELDALLAQPLSSAMPAVVAFAEGAVTGPASLALGGPARRVLPFLARHRAAVGARRSESLLPKLVQLSGDAALRADAPTAVSATSVGPRETLRPSGRAGTPGLVRDARTLPDGRLLVACGAEGVRLLSPEGVLLHTFACVADKLVPSESGTRAIAVARDSGLHRLTRLDLLGRKTQPWWEVSLTAFAPHFDGDRFMVAASEDLLCIDACAPGFEALHRVPFAGATIYAIETQGPHTAVLLDARGQQSVLRYELSTWRCVARDVYDAPVVALLPEALWATEAGLFTGRARPASVFSLTDVDAEVRGVAHAGHLVVWLSGGPTPTQPLTGPVEREPENSASHFVVSERKSAGVREVWTALTLDGNARGMRLDGEFLTVWDELGRVHSLHLPTASLNASIPVDRG